LAVAAEALAGATLAGAALAEVVLVGAALAGAVLADAVLVGAALAGATLVGAVLVGAGDDDPSVDGAGVGAASPPLAASAGSASEFAGALLVAKSSVTFRVGSGALAGKIAAGVADGATDLGPDNNSGTTRTMSTTRIDAPISRSLTRRSITAEYIREAPCAAAFLRSRASRAQAQQCETSRTPRFYLGRSRPSWLPRMRQRRYRRP
jgi:hypothetical protein